MQQNKIAKRQKDLDVYLESLIILDLLTKKKNGPICVKCSQQCTDKNATVECQLEDEKEYYHEKCYWEVVNE